MHTMDTTISTVRKMVTAGAAMACLFAMPAANATFLTSDTLTAPTLVDFSQFTGGGQIINANGPVQVGGLVGEDIEYTGVPNNGLYAWNGGWSLVANGFWGSGRDGYLGQNNARPGDMFLTFNSGPVSAVGAFMNYCPDCGSGDDLIITAYDAAMAVLESYNVTLLADIVTPGGDDAGAFRGISRAQADIHAFGIYGHVQVIDDLVFERAAVPEPVTLLLLGVGLLGIGSARRRCHDA